MAELGELIIPEGYESKLSLRETEAGIKEIKHHFQEQLSKALNVFRVSSPPFLPKGTGVNDDLNGVERKATFEFGSGVIVEAPNSLAKWKRQRLAHPDGSYKVGEGIYVDMNGFRVDDVVDNLHSHYVDQWDWEKTISKEDRTLAYLKDNVKKIYDAIRATSSMISKEFPVLKIGLPESITFVNAEDLQKEYPDLHPTQREDIVAKKYGAVFIRGIGAELDDGSLHDGRAPDYDDWTTIAEDGKKGLNGDIVVYNPILDRRFELSSMGIRVDPESMMSQLEIRAQQTENQAKEFMAKGHDSEAQKYFDLASSYRERVNLEWHKRLLTREFPLSIGGGIGQSRLCMLLLDKAHIGEVQVSVWPDEMREKCYETGIRLLK